MLAANTLKAEKMLACVERELLLERTAVEIAAVLASELGVTVTRGRVAQLVQILRLPHELRDAVRSGALTTKHGSMLAGLKHTDALELGRSAIRNKWSSATLHERIESVRRGEGAADASARIDPDIRRFCDEISEQLGSPVQLTGGTAATSYKGTLVVQFYSLDELDGIVERLRTPPASRREWD